MADRRRGRAGRLARQRQAEPRQKARDEWKKWWDANEKKVDLAKLDQESSYGLTIVCESPFRGGLGRVVALGGDGKERWKVTGLNWPMDAVPLAGKKVLIAEHNRNRDRRAGDRRQGDLEREHQPAGERGSAAERRHLGRRPEPDHRVGARRQVRQEAGLYLPAKRIRHRCGRPAQERRIRRSSRRISSS